MEENGLEAALTRGDDQAPSFTPGPWRLDLGLGRASVSARDFTGAWKQICARVRGGSMSAARSNARLIAAAPEMFEALTKLLQHSGVADAAPEDKDGEDHQAEHAARAALRKAQGHPSPDAVGPSTGEQS